MTIIIIWTVTGIYMILMIPIGILRLLMMNSDQTAKTIMNPIPTT